jgi:hypothetical protein
MQARPEPAKTFETGEMRLRMTCALKGGRCADRAVACEAKDGVASTVQNGTGVNMKLSRTVFARFPRNSNAKTALVIFNMSNIGMTPVSATAHEGLDLFICINACCMTGYEKPAPECKNATRMRGVFILASPRGFEPLYSP